MRTGLIVFSTKAVSGWGVRVRSMACMLSTFSQVQLMHAETDPEPRDRIPEGAQCSSFFLAHPTFTNTLPRHLAGYEVPEQFKVSSHRRHESIGTFQ